MTKLKTSRGLAFFTLLIAIVIASTLGAAQAKRLRTKPTVLAAVAPTYPGVALAVPRGGDVVIEVSIGNAGKVKDAAVIVGASPLRHPAVVAARRWRFAPEDAGQSIRLTFSFRIMSNGTPAEELTPIFKPPYALEVRRTMPEPVVNYGK